MLSGAEQGRREGYSDGSTPPSGTGVVARAPSARRCRASILLIVAPLEPALAQQAGIQVVVVVAQTGDPVAGVDVEFSNADIGYRRVLTSSAQGVVRLEGLPTAGTYEISARPGELYDATAPAAVSLRFNFTQSVTVSLARTAVEEVAGSER